MPAKHTIITIDGPAGTGKSTVAKELAQTLRFLYFSTGALYRAVTWKIIQEAISLSDLKAIATLLKTFSFCIEDNRYFVEGVDVTTALKDPVVTMHVSEVSALGTVREGLKPIQISAAKERDIVFEGRDLGTVIFPNADIKFFLAARLKVRVERRFKELQRSLPQYTLSLEQTLKEMRERDQSDLRRTLAPLKRAEDAILIDTSDLNVEEVVNKMKEHYLNTKTIK